KVSTRELADLLSMRPDTVKEYFGRLKAKGVLRREGSSRSGYWIVLQNVEKN
ncbi:MAG: AAA family ATPase, partial [Candidatus Electrothrix sp. AR1]|nr:AAA family ATPase [Candidatus Electrothrix sp. AR1]